MAAARKQSTNADGTAKKRVAKNPQQIVESAKKSVSRAAASVMQLHLKALSTDNLGQIADAARALTATFTVPTEGTVDGQPLAGQ